MDAEVSPLNPTQQFISDMLTRSIESLEARANELDDYEKFCASTDVGAQAIQQVLYPLDMYYALGLGGEVGEVLEKVKKSHRDGVLDVRQLELELGDVLWYAARLANFHGLTLRGCLAANIEKLSSRRDRGKLRGSGDNR